MKDKGKEEKKEKKIRRRGLQERAKVWNCMEFHVIIWSFMVWYDY